MSVILETSLGDIIVDLYINERPRCWYLLHLSIPIINILIVR